MDNQHPKHIRGDSVKAISDNRVAGYLVRFTNAEDTDLHGEYFDKDTDFWTERGYPIKGAPILIEHGFDDAFKVMPVGVLEFVDERDAGIWVEGKLHDREEYREMLRKMRNTKKLDWDDERINRQAELITKTVKAFFATGEVQWSSGALPQSVEVDDRHIKSWAIIEGTGTMTPAEADGTEISILKSAFQDLNDFLNQNKKSNPTAVDGSSSITTHQWTLPDDVTLSTGRIISGDTSTAPNQQTDSPTGHKETTGSKDDTGASTDIEPMPQVNEAHIDEATSIDHKGHKQMTLEEMLAMLEQLREAMTAFGQDSGASEDDAMQMADEVEDELAKMEDEDELKTLTPEAIAEKAFNLYKAKIEQHQKASKAAQSAFKAQVTNWQKAQPAKSNLPAYTGNGNGATPQKSNIQMSGDRRFEHWKSEDFLFAAMIDKQIRAKGKQGIISDATKFYRELADRAERTGYVKNLSGTAVKSLNFIKANELNHSTQTSFGDEWVPDSWDNNLWRKARIDTVVMPQFRVVEMPTNPFELPIEGTDSTMYYVAETTAENQLTLADGNSPIPDSKIGSGKVQLSAKKFGTRVGFSAELEEDSIIPVLNIYREQAETAFNEGIDDVLLNGDTETGSTNINQDGSALGATSRYLAFDGLRKDTFTNSTNQVDASGGVPTLNLIRKIRFLLSRQVSTKIPGLRIFTNPEAYAKLLNMDEFLTMDKAGPNATAQTGQIGLIDNIPVLVSDQLPLADTDGKVTNGGNGTDTGTIVIAYVPHWYVGYRRRLVSDLSYIPYYDSYQLTLTARMDFVTRDSDSAAMLFNVAI